MKDGGPNNRMPAEDDFEAMLEASFSDMPKLEPGMKIEAGVTSIGEENVFLDVGTNLDGVISKEELRGEEGLTVQVGDVLECFVSRIREGAVHCTTRLGASSDGRAGREAAVSSLNDAMESGIPVEGKVSQTVKGGVRVSMLGLEAFCPISQINNAYVEDPEFFVGQTLLFRVLRVEEDGRNVVVSRRQLLEEEAAAKSEELWASMEVGNVVDGTVTNIRSYGAFVDIGGIEGLLHVSEIAHERIEDPRDKLSVGESVRVQIIKLDPAEKKISLSVKALQEHPSEAPANLLQAGSVVLGKVTRLKAFGAFVEVAPGVEGLVHISELGGEKRIAHPKEVLAEGQSLEVKVVSLERERRRISLKPASNDEISEEDQAFEALKREKAEKGEAGFGTLGDILNRAIEDEGKKRD